MPSTKRRACNAPRKFGGAQRFKSITGQRGKISERCSGLQAVKLQSGGTLDPAKALIRIPSARRERLLHGPAFEGIISQVVKDCNCGSFDHDGGSSSQELSRAFPHPCLVVSFSTTLQPHSALTCSRCAPLRATLVATNTMTTAHKSPPTGPTAGKAPDPNPNAKMPPSAGTPFATAHSPNSPATSSPSNAPTTWLCVNLNA